MSISAKPRFGLLSVALGLALCGALPSRAYAKVSVVYRFDTRPPSEIFSSGFAPRGGDTNLIRHALAWTEESAFIATTASLEAAENFANTYVQADPAVGLGNLDSLPLTELIIKTGIHDAIARKLNAKGMTRNAIAETIINNVRRTIIREQLTDPRFYERMSKLLQDLIKQSRDDAASYELFLQNAEKLVRTIAKKDQVAGIPAILHGRPEAIVIYNNLEPILARMAGGVRDVDERRAGLALEIDRAMREEAPAGWKGDATREAEVRNALYPIMGRDREATRAVFEIIKQQPGYT